MLGRHGERFLRRCFSSSEAEYCRSRRDPVPELAVRMAAKEAAFKAIGGRRGMGLGWRCFEVALDDEGVPFLRLRGAAEARAKKMGVGGVWLSLTHEDEWSGAVVLLTGGAQGAPTRSE
jgi:holo-[acyl-carrier protein] synthase